MKDCFAYYDKESSVLHIGNCAVEKLVRIKGSFISTESINDRKNGRAWCSDRVHLQRCPVLGADEAPSVSFEVIENESPFGMAPHIKAVLKLCGTDGTAYYEYTVFPNIPFIYTQAFAEKTGSLELSDLNTENTSCTGIEIQDAKNRDGEVFCSADTLDAVPLGGAHLELEAYKLYDKTDINDSLAEHQKTSLYKRGRCEREGNIFCINDYPRGDAIMLVKHSPTQSSALNRKGCDLAVEGTSHATLLGCGIDFNNMPCGRVQYYASAVGVGKISDIYGEFWRYGTAFSAGDPRKNMFIMSNTWGDRSQDMAVCEEFILKEIECAAKIGVDILQIDDGWQAGITANSLKKKGGVWEGYYSNNENFWQVNPERFPNGMEPIIAKAAECGVELGFWFSPDSSNDFINVERDIETLLSLYEKYGIRYFKLDGVKIRNKLSEMRFIHLLDELTHRTQGSMRFNLDVTAEDRFGYLYEMQFGTLFVENRYTDFVNYFPHNTFKNLWQLSKLIPTRRLQMELLNKRRNAEKYENIPFAPSIYGMDYIFAVVIPANPLVWMEMTHLYKDDAELLSKIVGIYKKHSEDIFFSRVIPIGEQPNGMSFSGYFCRCEESKNAHVLLFRESSDCDTYSFKLPQCISCEGFELIYKSAEAEIDIKSDTVAVKFGEPRSFVWLKVNY